MVYHQELSHGRWSELTLVEQLGNIGSEVSRMINWRDKDKDIAERAFERVLELIDFTLANLHNKYRLREIARSRELLVTHWIAGSPTSALELDRLNKYFFQFALLANSKS
ncbi:TPA: hypothetical protein DIV45_01175 [Patescibacteria group bacterium]|nr:hypothetical protein [Patescibacteria group bacterium]